MAAVPHPPRTIAIEKSQDQFSGRLRDRFPQSSHTYGRKPNIVASNQSEGPERFTLDSDLPLHLGQECRCEVCLIFSCLISIRETIPYNRDRADP
jgi:hypothetical protein